MKYMNADKNKLPLKRRLPLITMIGAIIVVMLILVFVQQSWFGEDTIKVDFTDVFIETNGQIDTTDDNRPVLCIAVAAMISPKPTQSYYNDLLTLIGNKLGRRTLFLQRKTYAEVNQLLKKKEIDVAFVCSGPYVTGHSEFGMELLVVPVAHGKTVYYSYIIVGKNSPVKTFEDLRGKKFVFSDPHSNTGKLVPTYMLALRGETAESFFKETFYSHSHDNSIRAVAEGLADGAAVDSLIWEFMNAIDPVHTAGTKIIEKSPPYGIPPVVVHPDLSLELKQKLKDMFLHLHEDKKAAHLLRLLQIDRFEEGKDEMYDSVRNMQKWLAKSKEGEK